MIQLPALEPVTPEQRAARARAHHASQNIRDEYEAEWARELLRLHLAFDTEATRRALVRTCAWWAGGGTTGGKELLEDIILELRGRDREPLAYEIAKHYDAAFGADPQARALAAITADMAGDHEGALALLLQAAKTLDAIAHASPAWFDQKLAAARMWMNVHTAARGLDRGELATDALARADHFFELARVSAGAHKIGGWHLRHARAQARAELEPDVSLADALALFEEVAQDEAEFLFKAFGAKVVELAVQRLLARRDARALNVQRRFLDALVARHGATTQAALERYNLGAIYCELGQLDEAADHMSRGYVEVRESLGDDAPLVMMCKRSLDRLPPEIAARHLRSAERARAAYLASLGPKKTKKKPTARVAAKPKARAKPATKTKPSR